MTATFDPNIPSTGPSAPAIEGEITDVAITEPPALGRTNLVVNPHKTFDITVSWHVFGNLVPLWLTALSVGTQNWVVTAYAESEGPGEEKLLEKTYVPIGGPPFTDPMDYHTTITVPASTLHEENPGDPYHSGVYKIVVTVFLNSELGGVGYDMMGYADGPIIKVEDPL